MWGLIYIYILILIYIYVLIYHYISVCGSTYDPLSCMNSINYTAKRPGAGVQSDRRFLGCRRKVEKSTGNAVNMRLEKIKEGGLWGVWPSCRTDRQTFVQKHKMTSSTVRPTPPSEKIVKKKIIYIYIRLPPPQTPSHKDCT